MPLKHFISILLLCCHACRQAPPLPQKARFTPLEGFRFHQPCGEPVLAGTMPGGNYLAYVLQDSLQIADCMGKINPTGRGDTVPMRSGRDFLLLLRPSVTATFRLHNMEITDSMLHIHLRPDTAAKAGACMWKIEGDGVKLIRLAADPLHYAYVPGPAWNGTPVQLRQAHWKE